MLQKDRERRQTASFAKGSVMLLQTKETSDFSLDVVLPGNRQHKNRLPSPPNDSIACQGRKSNTFLLSSYDIIMTIAGEPS